jgi:hypothetical protein
MACEPYYLGHTLLLLTPNVDSNGLLVNLPTFVSALRNEYSILWTTYQRRLMGFIGVLCDPSIRQIASWRTVFSAASL